MVDYEVKPYDQLSAWDKRSMKRLFEMKTYKWAKEMGVTYAKITIKNQKTRWGSCSGRGNINYNYKLYFLPEKYQDYIVIHELAHRKHMNHSDEFWDEVVKYCPNWKETRKELKSLKL